MSAFLTTVINGGSACFTRYGDVNHLIALCAKIFEATFESFEEAAPSAVDASFDFLDLKAAPKLATVTPKFAPSTACLGPRAAAARAKAAEAPIQEKPAEAVEAPAHDFPEAIQCDLLPNVFKESSDEPDLIGEVTLDGEELVIYAVENKRARKNQPVWLLEFVTDVAQQREAQKRLTAIREYYFRDYMRYLANPPQAGAGQGFHGWLKGAANMILARKFTDLTGYKFCKEQAVTLLEESSRQAGADEVRPATWRIDVEATVSNVLDSEPDYNGKRGDRPDKPKAVVNMARILELAPTHSQAALISASPIQWHGDSRNHCQEAISALFRPFWTREPDDYRVVFVDVSANGKGMSFFPYRLDEAQHAEIFPWVVPHLMKPEGGRGQHGRHSKKCDDAVAKRCYGVLEFDWKPTAKNENALAILAKLNEAGTHPKDAMASIIHHLAEYRRLAMVVDSGNGSLHAWFYIGDETEESWLNFRGYGSSLGSDADGSGLSQQFRNPDGYHANGNRQQILYFNPVEETSSN